MNNLKIKILGSDYDVIFEKFDASHLDRCAHGLVYYYENKIVIDSGVVSEDYKKSILIHEILHVLDHELQLKIRHDDIFRLNAGIFQVMSDNPQFLDLFKKTESDEFKLKKEKKPRLV